MRRLLFALACLSYFSDGHADNHEEAKETRKQQLQTLSSLLYSRGAPYRARGGYDRGYDRQPYSYGESRGMSYPPDREYDDFYDEPYGGRRQYGRNGYDDRDRYEMDRYNRYDDKDRYYDRDYYDRGRYYNNYNARERLPALPRSRYYDRDHFDRDSVGGPMRALDRSLSDHGSAYSNQYYGMSGRAWGKRGDNYDSNADVGYERQRRGVRGRY